MGKLLLVEDDQGLNQGITYALEQDGHEVKGFTTGLDCLNHANENYDLAILDISLPDVDGFTVAKRLKTFRDIPIVFLTAKDEEADLLKGYDLGCEDYVTKPFSLPVLIQKIRVILKRTQVEEKNTTYHFGALKFDFEGQLFYRSEEQIFFTAKEVQLLELFIKNKGSILTKNQIMEHIWDSKGDFVDENTLSVNIRRLRKKIEEDPKNPIWIKTVFGIGYKWCS